MTSEVDTRDVERLTREEASRHLDAFPSARRIVATRLYDAAQAIAQERAARERAEAETKKWKEVAAREWERARKAETMLAQARQP
jgi:hypothetical protein